MWENCAVTVMTVNMFVYCTREYYIINKKNIS